MLLPADSCIYMHQPTRKHPPRQAEKRSVCCRAPHLMGYHTCFVSFYIFVGLLGGGGVIEYEFFLMTFLQCQSFRSFPTALAIIPQAGRTLNSCLWDGLSGTMHFFGSTLGPVPRWEHYKVLCKYHCVLSQWFHRSSQLRHLGWAPRQVIELIIVFH